MAFSKVSTKLGIFKININNKSGRNHQGQIVVRHRGGRSNWALLRLDNFRATFDLPSLVLSYAKRGPAQPLAALIKYPNGCLSYITAPHGLGPGSYLYTWLGFDHFFEARQPGNNLSLVYIHQGDHLIELYSLAGRRYP